MYILKHRHASEKHSTRGRVERQIQHEAKPSALFVSRHILECCIFHTDKLDGALIDILYFLKLVSLAP